ncbi:HD domain-containing protein [Actinomadura roseirufa]|uniref:HD domain-containing protein n=1 Tax=Actinomadura roseirufa TaxID=2094049 RepID=UPI001040F0F5|nr:HD domain-containing protein [Actinomadura roseirufa]
MADQFAEFAIPDTDLTRKAYALVFETETTALAHHSVRAYLFGRALGELRGLHPGADYNDEMLFLAAVMHDIGLTEDGDGDQRFELDGADLAADFLRASGVDESDIQSVWEAIALHTSRGLAHRFGPVTALVHAGIGTDVAAVEADTLPAGLAERVHAAFPRLDQDCGLGAAITGQIARDPGKAPIGSLPFEVARQFGVDLTIPLWKEETARAWPGVA